MLYRAHIARAIFELVVIGTDCICSCKSNYHTITTTTTPERSDGYMKIFGRFALAQYILLLLQTDFKRQKYNLKWNRVGHQYTEIKTYKP